jgi:hypothetical protein
MVTLVFQCPRCRTDCICGVTSDDDSFGFCAGVPVRLACWVCGSHSFVVHRIVRFMFKDVRPECFSGECLERAAECRHRAIFSQEEAARQLLRLESCWLSLSQYAAVPGGVVAARCMRVGRQPSARPGVDTATPLIRANDEPLRFRSGALNGVQP